MTLRDLLFLIGGATSFAGCYVLDRLLRGLRVPAYLAIVLACGLSYWAHHWFWVDWYGANSRHGGFFLWVGIHPLYLIGAIQLERDARRKQASAAAQEPAP
jgi:hypothetical protein